MHSTAWYGEGDWRTALKGLAYFYDKKTDLDLLEYYLHIEKYT